MAAVEASATRTATSDEKRRMNHQRSGRRSSGERPRHRGGRSETTREPVSAVRGSGGDLHGTARSKRASRGYAERADKNARYCEVEAAEAWTSSERSRWWVTQRRERPARVMVAAWRGGERCGGASSAGGVARPRRAARAAAGSDAAAQRAAAATATDERRRGCDAMNAAVRWWRVVDRKSDARFRRNRDDTMEVRFIPPNFSVS
ncbi:hypothetical protein Scep_022062 [Stephania cephalantha]|uniref:Uncharacterized protein n=1 Tax=Stephania cephalantha TaxID=152367 RepID=A0AAP0FDE6_9MAGN